MGKRKPVLLIDGGPDSLEAVDLFKKYGIEFARYDVRKFAESCCGDLPTTKAPSVVAPEGLFKGLSGVMEYISAPKTNSGESESAYW